MQTVLQAGQRALELNDVGEQVAVERRILRQQFVEGQDGGDGCELVEGGTDEWIWAQSRGERPWSA